MELTPLATYTASMAKTEMVAPTPLGQRFIVGVKDARWDGERIQASQRGSSATDWLLQTADGTAHVDVRLTLRTDDGALIYVTYGGRGMWPDGAASGPVYCAFTFETGDERYSWMNSILAVAEASSTVNTSPTRLRNCADRSSP